MTAIEATTDTPAPDTSVVVPISDSQTMKRAFRDLSNGFRQRELWLSLGWQDIKQRYRRSVLGPFWISIATGVQAAAMGLLYGALFDQEMSQMMPYVTVGLIVWNLINASILEGSDVFIANEGLIKQLPSALSVHIYRLVWRQILFFLHNMAIYLIVAIGFGTWKHLGWGVLLAIPAIMLLVANAGWVSIVFGILSTRYRDIKPILGSTTMMLFVLTPVFWTTDSLHDQGGKVSERAKLVEVIPTYHYLDIIRQALLGKPQQAYHWYIVIAITVVGWAAALLALRKFRSRVPYWV